MNRSLPTSPRLSMPPLHMRFYYDHHMIKSYYKTVRFLVTFKLRIKKFIKPWPSDDTLIVFLKGQCYIHFVRAFDHILIRWVCVLALSATVLLSSKALVICVGHNGHAALEWAHQELVCDAGTSHPPESADVYVAHHCHSACTDLALPPVVVSRPTHGRELVLVDLVDAHILFQISWDSCILAEAPRLSIAGNTQHDQQIDRSLSSTVLLI